MKNLKQIDSMVNKEMTEESVLIYFNVDLNDIAPFMCSPYAEGWLWADQIKILVEYIFEIIISAYLVKDVMAFGDFENENDEDFDFQEAVKIYTKYQTMDEEREESINSLVNLYNENVDKEISYFEFVKLLVAIEKYSQGVGIDFIIESFLTPLEARHSQNLNSEEFDFDDLSNNFKY